MNLSKALLMQHSGVLMRTGIFVISLALAFAIGYLHILTGLAYEFHVMFVLPVLIAAGLVGSRSGYALALLSASVWLVADRILAGDQAELYPLLFNTGMRLAIFLGAAWLLGEMRHLLLRESQLAREDALTQLPNRREFHERGQRAFAQAQFAVSYFCRQVRAGIGEHSAAVRALICAPLGSPGSQWTKAATRQERAA